MTNHFPLDVIEQDVELIELMVEKLGAMGITSDSGPLHSVLKACERIRANVKRAGAVYVPGGCNHG